MIKPLWAAIIRTGQRKNTTNHVASTTKCEWSAFLYKPLTPNLSLENARQKSEDDRTRVIFPCPLKYSNFYCNLVSGTKAVQSFDFFFFSSRRYFVSARWRPKRLNYPITAFFSQNLKGFLRSRTQESWNWYEGGTNRVLIKDFDWNFPFNITGSFFTFPSGFFDWISTHSG